jgi:hypothetical protein
VSSGLHITFLSHLVMVYGVMCVGFGDRGSAARPLQLQAQSQLARGSATPSLRSQGVLLRARDTPGQIGRQVAKRGRLSLQISSESDVGRVEKCETPPGKTS